jgi:hypothetical protein
MSARTRTFVSPLPPEECLAALRDLGRRGGGAPGTIAVEERANGEIRAWRVAEGTSRVARRPWWKESSEAMRIGVARMRLSPHDGGTRIGMRFGKLHMVWTPLLILVGLVVAFSGVIPAAVQAGAFFVAAIAALVPLALVAAWVAFVRSHADDRDVVAAQLTDILRALPPEAARGVGYRVAMPAAPVDVAAAEEEEWPDSTDASREQRRL